MNSKVVIGIIIAVVTVVGGGTFVTLNNTPSDTKSGASKASETTSYKVHKACELLTEAEAKQLMGESTTLGTNNVPTKSEDVSIDTCSYVNNATSVPAIKVITVMARSALSEDGLESNQVAFEKDGAANPANATAISGYGDKAFWDPATHQLAILKDTSWISIVYGGTNPTSNTLDDAKKVADLVVK